jgi:hypothetical protein
LPYSFRKKVSVCAMYVCGKQRTESQYRPLPADAGDRIQSFSEFVRQK